MKCYECEKESQTLYPIERTIGKVTVEIYVCKDCMKASKEVKE